MVACVEEIAFTMGWSDAARLRATAAGMKGSAYGLYLLRLADGEA